MAYIAASQIYSKIPQPKVNDALDDDGDGVADAGSLDQVIANAGTAVDGRLGARYPTPFAARQYTAPTIRLVGAVTPGVSQHPVLTPTVVGGSITAVAITNAGSGLVDGVYTGNAVQINDPTGIGAQLYVAVDGGVVTQVNVVSGGESGLPAIVAQAALIFACEEIYKRREVAGSKNPYTGEADKLRERLDLIAQRKMPLDANQPEGLVAGIGGNPVVPGRLGTQFTAN